MSTAKFSKYWSIGFKITQVVFFIGILICTVYNLNLTVKQTNLIFKPVIGVVDIKTTRILGEDKEDTYENVRAVKIDFTMENAGNLPAKNFKIKKEGKIGNIILPYIETESNEGIVLIQNTKVTNSAVISKSTIKRLVEKEEKLIYTIEFSYSDWENYKDYNYSSRFEIYVLRKSPLELGTKMLPEK